MTYLFPSLIANSCLVVGSTSKSYKVSVIFIGTFGSKKLATRSSAKKYFLVEKSSFDMLYGYRVDGENLNGFPNIEDEYLAKDSCPLYQRDWSNCETWEVI